MEEAQPPEVVGGSRPSRTCACGFRSCLGFPSVPVPEDSACHTQDPFPHAWCHLAEEPGGTTHIPTPQAGPSTASKSLKHRVLLK